MSISNANLFMQNREISWLRFNDRVLSEAEDKNLEPYEKLRFISIFASNLDEFFMVRVGSLHDLSLLKNPTLDSKTGMTPSEQIDAILDILPAMYEKKDRLYKKTKEELRLYNINELDFGELSKEQQKSIKQHYREDIKPILSPQIIDKQHPFPFIDNLQPYVFMELEKKNSKCFGLIPIPSSLKNYFLIQGEAIDFILTEKIVYELIDDLFDGYEVKNKSIICVTRNFDLDADNEMADEFDDYKDKMKMILKKRKRQSAVRLESNHNLSSDMKEYLFDVLKINSSSYFYTTSPLNMNYVSQLIDVLPSAKKEKVLYPDFVPYYNEELIKNGIMNCIEKKDLLLSYPYDDIKTFVDLLKEASDDERVLSIKITIYRLSKISEIAKQLMRAAENGKEVLIIMELKARFDEERNINYANLLEQAGCKIIFGFDRFKVHSKLCLITYKEKNGHYKYITQVGTGNYNETTSHIYADFSLITSNREIGLDASDFFNNMSVGNLNGKYEHLIQSPSSLKDKFLKLIDRETKKGSEGYIFLKMNSFTDKDFINHIQNASEKGVKVFMVIRGICCILPNIPKVTDNIEIHGIVGRFLEHARVYQFGQGPDSDIYISSADLMTRNTEKRVEIGCPIYDRDIKLQILNYLRIQLDDDIKGRILNKDGNYEIFINKSGQISSQAYLMKQAEEKHYIQENNKKLEKEKSEGFFSKIFKR